MSGMHFEDWLGYDDSYVSTEQTRAMYQQTWNAIRWLPCGHLNLTSQIILIALETTSYAKQVTETIYHAQ